jgi:hypothetical protein
VLTYAQVCGRYLFLNKLTHERTALMINAMLRLKAHKNLDNRYNTMIENAYYICRPAVQSARAKRKVRDVVTAASKACQQLVMQCSKACQQLVMQCQQLVVQSARAKRKVRD